MAWRTLSQKGGAWTTPSIFPPAPSTGIVDSGLGKRRIMSRPPTLVPSKHATDTLATAFPLLRDLTAAAKMPFNKLERGFSAVIPSFKLFGVH